MSILFLVILMVFSLLRMPLSLIPILLKGVFPFFKTRLEFERKNFGQEHSQSFRQERVIAALCFEVSSEGELEQVGPLIEDALEKAQRIEILFSSPSVEKKLEHLSGKYPKQVRLLRLPLLSFWPFSFFYFQNFWLWVTAPVVVFCRYDFFPELLLLKLFGKKFVLVSATTKNLRLYKKMAFKLFDFVVAATPGDQKRLRESLKAPVLFCDLRIPRIGKRKTGARNLLLEHEDPKVARYCQWIHSLRAEEKIIFGSLWPSDLPIFNDVEFIEKVKKGKLYLSIVPHKLDPAHVGILMQDLKAVFGIKRVGLLSNEHNDNWMPVTIIDRSGILCELYTLYQLAYVGGGYERSIHSVLEPFISGAQVICGPKIHRSTEYDLIAESAFSEIQVLKKPVSFYTIVKDLFGRQADQGIRTKMLTEALANKGAIIEEIQKLRV